MSGTAIHATPATPGESVIAAVRPGPASIVTRRTIPRGMQARGARRAGESREDRVFRRALGWSVFAHLVVASTMASLAASRQPDTTSPAREASGDVAYTWLLVDEAVEASEVPGLPAFAEGTNAVEPAPREPTAASTPAAAEPFSSREAEREQAATTAGAAAPPEERGAVTDVAADPSLLTTPTLLSPAMAAPTIAAPALSAPTLALPSPTAPSGTSGAPGATGWSPKAENAPVSRAARDGEQGPRGEAGSGIPGGVGQANGARGVMAGDRIGAAAEDHFGPYRARVAAWIRPRVERRFKADPEGRSTDASSSSMVQVRIAIDASGRGSIVELAAPSRALERILRDVIASGTLPVPPAALSAPVTVSLRIRFTLA